MTTKDREHKLYNHLHIICLLGLIRRHSFVQDSSLPEKHDGRIFRHELSR